MALKKSPIGQNNASAWEMLDGSFSDISLLEINRRKISGTKIIKEGTTGSGAERVWSYGETRAHHQMLMLVKNNPTDTKYLRFSLKKIGNDFSVDSFASSKDKTRRGKNKGASRKGKPHDTTSGPVHQSPTHMSLPNTIPLRHRYIPSVGMSNKKLSNGQIGNEDKTHPAAKKFQGRGHETKGHDTVKEIYQFELFVTASAMKYIRAGSYGLQVEVVHFKKPPENENPWVSPNSKVSRQKDRSTRPLVNGWSASGSKNLQQASENPWVSPNSKVSRQKDRSTRPLVNEWSAGGSKNLQQASENPWVSPNSKVSRQKDRSTRPLVNEWSASGSKNLQQASENSWVSPNSKVSRQKDRSTRPLVNEWSAGGSKNLQQASENSWVSASSKVSRQKDRSTRPFVNEWSAGGSKRDGAMSETTNRGRVSVDSNARWDDGLAGKYTQIHTPSPYERKFIIRPASKMLSVVFVVDNSRSMIENDPNNMRFRAIIDTISQMKKNNYIDLFSVIAFSRVAKIVQPFTRIGNFDRHSKSLLERKLKAVAREVVRGQGTSYQAPIKVAKNIIHQRMSQSQMGADHHREDNREQYAIFLLTDGEPTVPYNEEHKAFSKNIRIYTIGLGSKVKSSGKQDGGQSVGDQKKSVVGQKNLPLQRRQYRPALRGSSNFKSKNTAGQLPGTSQKILRRIAKDSGGRFFIANENIGRRLYKEVLNEAVLEALAPKVAIENKRLSNGEALLVKFDKGAEIFDDDELELEVQIIDVKSTSKTGNKRAVELQGNAHKLTMLGIDLQFSQAFFKLPRLDLLAVVGSNGQNKAGAWQGKAGAGQSKVGAWQNIVGAGQSKAGAIQSVAGVWQSEDRSGVARARQNEERSRQSKAVAVRNEAGAIQSVAGVWQNKARTRQGKAGAMQSEAVAGRNEARARQNEERSRQSKAVAVRNEAGAIQSVAGVWQNKARARQGKAGAMQSEAVAGRNEARARQNEAEVWQSKAVAMQSEAEVWQSKAGTRRNEVVARRSKTGNKRAVELQGNAHKLAMLGIDLQFSQAFFKLPRLDVLGVIGSNGQKEKKIKGIGRIGHEDWSAVAMQSDAGTRQGKAGAGQSKVGARPGLARRSGEENVSTHQAEMTVMVRLIRKKTIKNSNQSNSKQVRREVLASVKEGIVVTTKEKAYRLIFSSANGNDGKVLWRMDSELSNLHPLLNGLEDGFNREVIFRNKVFSEKMVYLGVERTIKDTPFSANGHSGDSDTVHASKIWQTPNPYSNPYSNPATHHYGNPAAHPYSNPAAHPYSNPAAHPYGNPAAHPYSNPATNPYGNPTTHPYSNPAAHPYSNPATHLSHSTSAMGNHLKSEGNYEWLLFLQCEGRMHGLSSTRGRIPTYERATDINAKHDGGKVEKEGKVEESGESGESEKKSVCSSVVENLTLHSKNRPQGIAQKREWRAKKLSPIATNPDEGLAKWFRSKGKTPTPNISDATLYTRASTPAPNISDATLYTHASTPARNISDATLYTHASTPAPKISDATAYTHASTPAPKMAGITAYTHASTPAPKISDATAYTHASTPARNISDATAYTHVSTPAPNISDATAYTHASTPTPNISDATAYTHASTPTPKMAGITALVNGDANVSNKNFFLASLLGTYDFLSEKMKRWVLGQNTELSDDRQKHHLNQSTFPKQARASLLLGKLSMWDSEQANRKDGAIEVRGSILLKTPTGWVGQKVAFIYQE